MSPVFDVTPGTTPLLISVPHDGRLIPEAIRARMTDTGRAVPDTDWHVAKLYEFARGLGAGMIVANYSRYVVDLNRSADDAALYPGQPATGLCPEQTFAGEDLYRRAGVSASEKTDRIEQYWQPYHAQIESELAMLRERFGHALLWDAHSIPSVVPRLFDGELPVLNLGSNDGKSCVKTVAAAVDSVAKNSGHSSVLNGRFKGGYITRHYGRPEQSVHALQLEIAQRAYMDETTLAWDANKAEALQITLRSMIRVFLDSARSF